MDSNEVSKVPVLLGNLLDPNIKGIISKEKGLILSEYSGPSQNSRVIRGCFCWYFTVFIIDTVIMAHSSPHKVVFHCCSNEKDNSKDNIYQASCTLAESVAPLCRTSTALRVLLQHHTVTEDKEITYPLISLYLALERYPLSSLISASAEYPT